MKKGLFSNYVTLPAPKQKLNENNQSTCNTNLMLFLQNTYLLSVLTLKLISNYLKTTYLS